MNRPRVHLVREISDSVDPSPRYVRDLTSPSTCPVRSVILLERTTSRRCGVWCVAAEEHLRDVFPLHRTDQTLRYVRDLTLPSICPAQ